MDFEVVWNGRVDGPTRGCLIVSPDTPRPAPPVVKSHGGGGYQPGAGRRYVDVRTGLDAELWRTVEQVSGRCGMTMRGAKERLWQFAKAGLIDCQVSDLGDRTVGTFRLLSGTVETVATPRAGPVPVDVRRAVDDEWRTADEIAARCGLNPHWARVKLLNLAIVNELERRVAYRGTPGKPRGGCGVMYRRKPA